MLCYRGAVALLAFLCGCSIRGSSGHGYLQSPAGRGSAWMFGFKTPPNYDHTGNYCGGFQVQRALGGKCGICGDAWNATRRHEAGGEFARNVITGRYKAGALIPIAVNVTANHEGWFEFRLCPATNPKAEVTQACLNSHLLPFDNGKTRRPVSKAETLIKMKVKLPDGLTCPRCVLQWKYHAGNNIYTCPDGRQSAACGPQEEFYNCADISISSTGPGTVQVTPPKVPTKIPMPATKPAVNPGVKCRAVGVWAKQPDMFTWCEENCPLGNCPADKCAC